MQVRWNFRLKPNTTQISIFNDWLVTLRKTRNYALRQRVEGWENNNKDVVTRLETGTVYAWGSYCDVESRLEYGACYPLTCPVQQHGVIPVDMGMMFKVEKKTGKTLWDSVGGVQSKVTTQLRKKRDAFRVIDSDVLQRNLANLDTAYTNFFKKRAGFPRYLRVLDSFEYKPGRVKLKNADKTYGIVYLPGIGNIKFYNSRNFVQINEIRTCTITRKASYFYISMLVDINQECLPIVEPKSVVGIDVGVNKLVALSDGSFIENKAVSTNLKTTRRLAIRHRAISRKQRGSKNRSKACSRLGKMQHKLSLSRDSYNWQAANKIVNTADSIAREDLKIKNMVKRAKPKPDAKGGYKRNGASAKTGLNKRIVDCGWGDLFQKVAWLAAKSGKPVFAVNPRHTSQQCPKCGHIEKGNRSGEKFVCRQCGYAEHADTGASRKIAKKGGLSFPPNQKRLPLDWGKVTPGRLSIPEWVESRNLNLSELVSEKKGYPVTKVLGESPTL